MSARGLTGHISLTVCAPNWISASSLSCFTEDQKARHFQSSSRIVFCRSEITRTGIDDLLVRPPRLTLNDFDERVGPSLLNKAGLHVISLYLWMENISTRTSVDSRPVSLSHLEIRLR